MPKSKKLKPKDEKILMDVYYSLGPRGSEAEKIIVMGITKEEKQEYLNIFVEMGVLSVNNGVYRKTRKGDAIFSKQRGFAERNVWKSFY